MAEQWYGQVGTSSSGVLSGGSSLIIEFKMNYPVTKSQVMLSKPKSSTKANYRHAIYQVGSDGKETFVFGSPEFSVTDSTPRWYTFTFPSPLRAGQQYVHRVEPMTGVDGCTYYYERSYTVEGLGYYLRTSGSSTYGQATFQVYGDPEYVRFRKWDGSDWQEMLVRKWNGTEWVMAKVAYSGAKGAVTPIRVVGTSTAQLGTELTIPAGTKFKDVAVIQTVVYGTGEVTGPAGFSLLGEAVNGGTRVFTWHKTLQSTESGTYSVGAPNVAGNSFLAVYRGSETPREYRHVINGGTSNTTPAIGGVIPTGGLLIYSAFSSGDTNGGNQPRGHSLVGAIPGGYISSRVVSPGSSLVSGAYSEPVTERIATQLLLPFTRAV